MKARRSTAPAKVSLAHECLREITQQQKMLKMKIGLDELLKTKG
jgi:hypothetical protein